MRNIKNAKQIIEAVDMDNVGYVFDAYNIYLDNGQNEFEAMKLVDKEKIFAIHLNSADDVPKQERKQEKRCFVDQGVIDINKFLNVLKEIDYRGMCSIETFRPQHWANSPQWVITNAYETTYAAMSKNNCI